MNSKAFKLNFYAFLWHSIFLALSSNFMNIDTIIPSLLIKAGGSNFQLGILTAILVGLSPFAQLFFGPILAPYKSKKIYLLLGIYIRILSLLALSFLLFKSITTGENIILILFIIISLFTLSGGFAGIAYTDILGKAIRPNERKKFFSLRQTITSLGLLISSIAVKKVLTIFNFPKNYGYLFFIAFLLLLIASSGFWVIREPESKIKNKTSRLNLLKLLPVYLKKDSNLFNYLLSINFFNFFISILPFFLMFLKTKQPITGKVLGNLLVAKILGMTIGGLLIHYFFKKTNYKSLLLMIIPLGIILPIIAFLTVKILFLYILVFFFIGIFFAFFAVANSGILIEISNEINRPIYTGLAGAGNIVGIIYPLLVGLLVKWIGFFPIFVFASVMLGFSLIFIKKIHCK